jgi:hypothetical protein
LIHRLVKPQCSVEHHGHSHAEQVDQVGRALADLCFSFGRAGGQYRS